MRLGDRLYVSLKYGGLAILDISDLRQPNMIGRLNWLESYPNSAHTTLPLPFKIRNRNWLVVVEEDSRTRFMRILPQAMDGRHHR